MRKLFVLCFLFAFMVNATAQQTKAEKAKAKTEKAAKDKAKKEVKSASPLKKDGTPDKRYKKADVPLKKDGTPDKRFKSNNATERGKEKLAEGKAKAQKEVKERVSKEKAPKNNQDKVTGSYKGKKVFTGPRGGKYYINKNGNKTYISED